ncbi:unnamed protein product (macronuclear) [Paramecium tetraurelia]|uniref:RING-type domain-containing protein n=1 Tax=Paramecium tetraurelia TaxID=5888 RepID=A0CZS1_PARTE|nr:uncharacterized protein GSPATT00011861001 [Paramecium tetraurelia]CAK76288.1 unnamed protein product [Paramecium tetraurelia]|eukprot:XP_001443685.1 hypothetical protein (macronuclear) [Paramecium tetraurelia strain d4-2]
MHKIKQTKQCAQCEAMDPSYSFGQCEHHFCQDCFKQILTNTVQSKKSKFQIKCPIDSCKHQIDLKELLKYLTLPNTCKRCNVEQSYTCGQCVVSEIEEIAKINYYSKLLKFETLINLESQQELNEEITKLELICPVCREFNQIPIIVCMQGHEICKDCYYNIRNIEDVRQACPICKQELLPAPPNSLRAQVLIKNLSIKCPNDNCKQVVKYPEFVQNHYRNCCEQKIECQDCHEKVEQLFQDIHHSSYCRGNTCPFYCARKLGDHQTNFIMEHIQSTMRQSDVAHSFLVRMQIIEKFLFRGSFGSCPQCEFQYAWQVDVRGIQQTFCFYCFQFTG